MVTVMQPRDRLHAYQVDHACLVGGHQVRRNNHGHVIRGLQATHARSLRCVALEVAGRHGDLRGGSLRPGQVEGAEIGPALRHGPTRAQVCDSDQVGAGLRVVDNLFNVAGVASPT